MEAGQHSNTSLGAIGPLEEDADWPSKYDMEDLVDEDEDWDEMDVERLIEERGRPMMKWECCGEEDEEPGCKVGRHRDQAMVKETSPAIEPMKKKKKLGR